ncbi:hypothetical protein D3C78_330440 [compost metagenome]
MQSRIKENVMVQKGEVVEGAGAGRFTVWKMVEKNADGSEVLVGYLVLGPGTGAGFNFGIDELGAATAKAIELNEEHLRPKLPWE